MLVLEKFEGGGQITYPIRTPAFGGQAQG